MAEIMTGGYQNIRDFVQANWKFIEVRDGAGVAILRKDTADSRVTWSHAPGAQTLELRIVLRGSDVEVSPFPRTAASSAIYNLATGGTPYSVETFTSFTWESSVDELTIKHQLQIPLVP